MAGEPKNLSEFLALPEETRFVEIGVVYFAGDDTITSCVDENGVGWMLGQDATGRWYRRRA